MVSVENINGNNVYKTNFRADDRRQQPVVTQPPMYVRTQPNNNEIDELR